MASWHLGISSLEKFVRILYATVDSLAYPISHQLKAMGVPMEATVVDEDNELGNEILDEIELIQTISCCYVDHDYNKSWFLTSCYLW